MNSYDKSASADRRARRHRVATIENKADPKGAMPRNMSARHEHVMLCRKLRDKEQLRSDFNKKYNCNKQHDNNT